MKKCHSFYPVLASKKKGDKKGDAKGVKWTKETAGKKGLTINDGKKKYEIQLKLMPGKKVVYEGKLKGKKNFVIVNDYKDEKNFKVILKRSS